mgnify:CR=1 FL=1
MENKQKNGRARQSHKKRPTRTAVWLAAYHLILIEKHLTGAAFFNSSNF